MLQLPDIPMALFSRFPPFAGNNQWKKFIGYDMMDKVILEKR